MGTPKEKAKELVEKFKELVAVDYKYDEQPIFELQKDCALIAVDEKEATLLSIIGSQKHLWTENEKGLFDDLQQVKQEIEKL